MMSDYLLLKWGTWKGYDFSSEKNARALDLMKKHNAINSSFSAMSQHETPEQIELICEIIDAFDGPIWNDWSGEDYTKDQAKEYIRGYRR
jgi:hypothetical protein